MVDERDPSELPDAGPFAEDAPAPEVEGEAPGEDFPEGSGGGPGDGTGDGAGSPAGTAPKRGRGRPSKPKVKRDPEEPMGDNRDGVRRNDQVYSFMGRRVSPRIMRYKNRILRCEGQQVTMTGSYGRDEWEQLCLNHFGGGIVQWTQSTTSIPARPVAGGSFKFAGIPNSENIILDCYNGDVEAAEEIIIGPAAPTNPVSANPDVRTSSPPPAPAQQPLAAMPDPMVEELRGQQTELKRMELQQLLEQRRAALEEARIRAADRRDERRQKERAERAARPGFAGRTFREEDNGSAFAFDGARGEAPDYSNPDAPRRPYAPTERSIGPRDLADILSRNSELQELRNELRELRTQKQGPGDTAMLMQLMIEANKANAQILQTISQSAQQNRESASARDMAMLKLFTEGNKSEKTFELLISALGVREDKRSNEVATMLKLMEAGANLAGGKGFDDEPWWQSLLRGLGDAVGPLAGKMLQGQGQPVAPAPQLALPRPVAPRKPAAAVPAPGQIESQVPNPAAFAVTPPTPQVTAAPARPALPQMEGTSVIAAPEEPETVQSPEEEMTEIVDAVLDDILAEAGKKPREAAWTDTVFELVPLATLQKVAKAEDYTALINEFQPYANVAKAAKLLTLLKNDPNMVPWLASGFEDLQERALEEVAKYPVDESAAKTEPAATPAPAAGPASAAETEPVEEELPEETRQ